jgi:hypothetical protein
MQSVLVVLNLVVKELLDGTDGALVWIFSLQCGLQAVPCLSSHIIFVLKMIVCYLTL